jgi:hypothetical protein
MHSLADDAGAGVTPPPGLHPGVALGVIKDARRRRMRRLARTAAAALVVAALAGGLAWALGGASHARGRDAATPSLASAQRAAARAGFDVRLVPTLSVGYAGWCEIPVERGRSDGSACGPLPTAGGPVLQAFGWGEAGRSVSIAVTSPEVASVRLGERREPTLSLPGLPYGLRAARLLNVRPGSRLVAYDASGQAISEPMLVMPSKLGPVQKWRRPQRPPAGACELRAPSGLGGLQTLGGSVEMTVKPYTGAIVGHAFTTCASAEYELAGARLYAFVLVDAARPTGFAPLLPGFHAIEHGHRLFADGGLVARRCGGGWIVVRQGRSSERRIALLEHLTAKTPSA